MPKDNMDQFDLYEEYQDLEGPTHIPPIRNAPGDNQRPRRKDEYGIISELDVAQALHEQADDRRNLKFTYQASKGEAEWLTDALGGFFEQSWFDDVLDSIKGGKEASVYQLKGNATSGQTYLAGKVYRPRIFRSMRNDHLYRSGRANLDGDGLQITNEGKLKAIRQQSGFGRSLSQVSWIEHEVQTMNRFAEAGCDVPRCFASGDMAILMEYIGGPDMAAPTLNTVNLDLDEANTLFQRVLNNIDRMLSCGRVHGDLSAYNILYWEGKITLIDFPQAVNPEQNGEAYTIFERDLQRVCDYFRRQGVKMDVRGLTEVLWKHHQGYLGREIDPALLDGEDDDDLAYWQKMTGRNL
jgi:RIO kinase 1